MDTAAAFAMAQANKDRPVMVFDWDKAATLIAERRPAYAGAGLAGDWDWTGGGIYRDGDPISADDTYTYLSSTWAQPQLDMDGDVIECWRYSKGDSDWGPHTYWPESALAILRAGGAA